MANNKSGSIFPLKALFLPFLRYFSLAVLTAIALSGCGSGGGGGGSGGASSTSGPNVLNGTAAAGAPLTNATVTLKDSTGATATTTTDANGNYAFDISTKHFPLMLEVQPNVPGAAPLFSAALTGGTINTTPLTALQVFEAMGRADPSQIFISGDFSQIGSSTLDYGKTTVVSNFVSQLTSNGLDPGSVDPITTPMVANGTGMDALLDHANVAIMGNNIVSVTDSAGECIPFGPPNVMTFAIDGIEDSLSSYIFGDPTAAQYVQKALNAACVPGIDQPRPFASNVTNPSVLYSNVLWSRIFPDETETTKAVAVLIAKLKDANARNKLATSHGGTAGPISIVAHSWGSVIAYVALTELAGDDTVINSVDPTIKDPTIKVNLITIGSPIECLTGACAHCPLNILSGCIAVIQSAVPSEFKGPIYVPSNVITWTNYVNAADPVANNISVLPQNSRNVTIDNEPVADCPTPPSSGVAGSTPPVASTCTSHGVYFDAGDGSIAPTLLRIRSLIQHLSVEQSPASPTTTTPPVSTTPVPPPPAFSLTASTPYCDTNTPAGPAVKLTWNSSDGAALYRVFRDGNAIGVNLTASQLSFLNNLGLIAGQTYSYKVQAINAGGTTWSNTVSVTILATVCSSATDPKITVGPSTLDFGNVAVGSCGTATVVVQHVMGTNPASGSISIGPNPPFSITSGGSFSVANGSAANVGIRFCPSSVLTYTGTVTVTSGAAFTGASTVALTGTGISTPTCTVSFNTPSESIDASGGQRQVFLTTSNSSCNWSATSNQAWVHNITPSSGTSSATLTYTVDPNSSAQSRTATITVGQATLTVIQLGTSASCTFSLGYTTQSVPASGGTFVDGLLASNQSCPRTAQSNATFITNVSPASGNGDANISYTMAPNTSTSPRSGTLTIAGLTLTVNQDGATPVIPNTPTGLSPGSTSSPGPTLGSTTVTVSWSASSGATSYIGGITDIATGTDVMTINSILGGPMSSYAILSPGKQYRWYVYACNSNGCSSSSPFYYFQTPAAIVTKVVTVANLNGGLLNLRSGPGIGNSIITTLPEGTTMNVIGGPTLADGFTWWNISGTPGTGWSVVGEWLTPRPQIGAMVTVSYTGGAGLNLRSTASLTGTIITTLPEGTQMTVFGGPVQANGYTWWAIQGVVGGTTYTGWSAVGDWLTPNPRY